MGARPLVEGELRTFLTTELSLGRPLAWDDHETALTSEVADDLLGDCMVDVGDMDADGKDDFLACSPGFPLGPVLSRLRLRERPHGLGD
ncbi:MAG: hypothetical protein VX899_22065 [Myxococcota bacterium]|nr:hypothetical protein [Myxococcota bacterium]